MMTEAYERDRHLIAEDRRVEIRFEDFIKDPIDSMRDIYTRLGISGFEQAEPKMRAFLDARSEHSVSKYRLPEPLRRKIVDRMGAFIDRYGYREAIEAAAAPASAASPAASSPEPKSKTTVREREPS
jgi:omega-hydroxy-beta-dihydromenaquinone-9 sulfotransferase